MCGFILNTSWIKKRVVPDSLYSHLGNIDWGIDFRLAVTPSGALSFWFLILLSLFVCIPVFLFFLSSSLFLTQWLVLVEHSTRSAEEFQLTAVSCALCQRYTGSQLATAFYSLKNSGITHFRPQCMKESPTLFSSICWATDCNISSANSGVV